MLKLKTYFEQLPLEVVRKIVREQIKQKRTELEPFPKGTPNSYRRNRRKPAATIERTEMSDQR